MKTPENEQDHRRWDRGRQVYAFLWIAIAATIVLIYWNEKNGYPLLK